MKKVWRYIIGWFFVVLGIIGCFLPILQGILFMAIGFLILAPEVPFIQRLLLKMRSRYPEVFKKAEEYKKKIKDRFGAMTGS
ncbi:MAG TPA: PGPGW domain-containing protein [Syntrophales bacterium]|jgi:uncharacterized membrane protein YbaN (DUF454 family)|nr:PGPGW domain-containing protein [Syntrophales bacterium]HOX95607.1 PGPGW domain-containing protein [Syntrophales bacterium]HPI56926.1 PGPGW domain-containing protein [Syntrophales bacterium]HPN23512.1 PGPGW domain-containing protein [Syntrophales bacterium]HQM27963.1 PGPGW domain-containing protein [Syntrophales bacterium]